MIEPHDTFEALQAEREHSAIPTPTGHWIMGQRWEDLLFLSWPVSVEAMRAVVPPGVDVDTFDGSAWISAVPFWMEGAHFRGLPPIPYLASFPEVNIRTYVRSGEHRAVWFLSLDTQSHINVFLARHAFHLPYVYADVRMQRGDEVRFRSERDGRTAAFEVTYRGTGEASIPTDGTLEQFLTERYSMVCASHEGALFRGDIAHDPWRLQQAEWTASRKDLLATVGLGLEAREPVAFYAAATQVALWAPVRLPA